jgi:hypothetical protein
MFIKHFPKFPKKNRKISKKDHLKDTIENNGFMNPLLRTNKNKNLVT